MSNYIEYDDILPSKIVGVDLFNKKLRIRGCEKGFDVENYLDKTEENVEKYIYNLRKNGKKVVFGIVTTYNCNLSCTYCYEKNYQNKTKFITEEKAKQIADYILKYAEKNSPVEIMCIFTGGEPLINKAAIYYISSYLFKNLEIRYGVKYSFSIVTNGTIKINKYEFEILKKNGLSLIQVSLDGPREIHNKRRISYFDAYQKTVDFIYECVEENIQISIRTNIDLENINYYELMLQEIKGLGKKGVILNLYKTETTLCKRCVNNNCESDNGFLFLKAVEIAKNNGFTVSHNPLFFNGCMSLVPFGQFIDPDGKIYKCGGMLGHEKEVVGTIYDEELENAINHYIDKKIQDDCLKCKMFPICAGGCIYNKHYSIKCNNEYKKKAYLKLRESTYIYLNNKGYRNEN